MLRTMELILGLQPLTQYDAAANPMFNSFTDKPNNQPYDAIKPAQSLTEPNSAIAPLAKESAAMNFSREDQAPEQLLNQAIWKSVKGADSQMPAPHTIAVVLLGVHLAAASVAALLAMRPSASGRAAVGG